MRSFSERPMLKNDAPGGSGSEGKRPNELHKLPPELLDEAKNAFIPKGKPEKKPEPESKDPQPMGISDREQNHMEYLPPTPPASSETEDK